MLHDIGAGEGHQPEPGALPLLSHALLETWKRRRGSLMATVMRVDDLELDTLRHRVVRAGHRLELTNREYAVLEYLMRNTGRIVSRTMLAEHVWEQDGMTENRLLRLFTSPSTFILKDL